MPKQVDHAQRRVELAAAVWRVVVREGIDHASLRLVAAEAGWSIGAIRHYFSTRDELTAFAVRHIADRVESRLSAMTAATPLDELRLAVREVVPISPHSRDESRVWLSYVARSAIDPKLRPAVEELWQALNGYLTERLAAAREAGQLAKGLDARREALRFQAVLDGLVIAGLTTPDLVTAPTIERIIDDHLDSLRAA